VQILSPRLPQVAASAPLGEFLAPTPSGEGVGFAPSLGSAQSDLEALDRRFSATAARINALKAVASSTSPSRMSMARRVFPSRLALKSPRGSSSDAPRRKV